MLFSREISSVIWNTFLAAIPVAMAYSIQELVMLPGTRGRGLVKTLIVIAGLVWFAFLPNTCYLLTEWRHFLEVLGYTNIHTRWQVDSAAAFELMAQTIFYIFYSGIGILTFTLAIRPIARILKCKGAAMWIWAIPFFLMMSVGVYLGLILRYNSWDLISRPGEVWMTIVEFRNKPVLLSFIMLFGGFLWLMYEAMDIWIDGLVVRWKERRKRPKCKGIVPEE